MATTPPNLGALCVSTGNREEAFTPNPVTCGGAHDPEVEAMIPIQGIEVFQQYYRAKYPNLESYNDPQSYGSVVRCRVCGKRARFDGTAILYGERRDFSPPCRCHLTPHERVAHLKTRHRPLWRKALTQLLACVVFLVAGCATTQTSGGPSQTENTLGLLLDVATTVLSLVP